MYIKHSCKYFEVGVVFANERLQEKVKNNKDEIKTYILEVNRS